MKNTSLTYRLIASCISLTLLIGISMPMGLHAEDMENCSMEHMGMMQHDDMSSMMDHDQPNHHDSDDQIPCDYGMACMCSIEEAPINTDVPLTKSKVQVVALHQDIYGTQIGEIPIITSESNHSPPVEEYSPPIFILHQSFLN